MSWFGPPVYRVGSISVIGSAQAPQANQMDLESVFLQLLADKGVTEIKQILQSGIFKHPTGALANSIQGKIEGKAVVWFSDVAYAQAQESGVRPHQMFYLLNKTVPLTLWKQGHETKIFRRVTLKSLMAGKWFNKGYPGKFFFQRGIRATIDQIPMLLKKAQDIVVQIY